MPLITKHMKEATNRTRLSTSTFPLQPRLVGLFDSIIVVNIACSQAVLLLAWPTQQ